MRRQVLVTVVGLAFLAAATAARFGTEPARIQTHDNGRAAGTLTGQVLRLRLETRKGAWYPNGDAGPSAEMVAFAEAGGPLQIPSPLIRVPAGTEVVASITNSLADSTLTVHGLVSRPVPVGTSAEPMKIGPGETRQVRFRLDAPGAYYYWATTMGRQFGFRTREDAQLSGAIIVDEPGPKRPLDRVMVIGEWADTTLSENAPPNQRLLFVVNGRAWPHTSRLSQRVGDTVRMRLINTSADVHPMHLHGFYYRVDSRGDGVGDTTYAAAARDFVVTERVRPGATTSISWVPERPGNWLFHCHFTAHFQARGPLGMPHRPSANDSAAHHSGNHAIEGMSGLVIGVNVDPRRAGDASEKEARNTRRRLRLLVRPSGGTAEEPFYAFTLHERGPEPALDTTIRTGQPIVLKRGEPVSIMVVNRTPEPTAVHWHGIELDSYFDGVAGFSGTGRRLSPVVAPRDSFEARFTPPRSGTFIYHTHVDEPRQQPAGLSGALLVVDETRPYDAATDIPVLITTPRSPAAARRNVVLNGRLPAAPVELRAGVPHRFRLINITIGRPSINVQVVRDTSLVQWRAVAKDGAELTDVKKVVRRARQMVSIGETYDFEIVPEKTGEMRLEVRSGIGVLLATMPLIVK